MVNRQRLLKLMGAALLALAFAGVGSAADGGRATAPLPGGIDPRPHCDAKSTEPACLSARLHPIRPLPASSSGPGSIMPRQCVQVCKAGAELAKDCDRCMSQHAR